MKKILFLILVIVCCIKVYSQQQTTGSSPFEHVIVIGIDGMSSEGLMKAKTPYMDQLIEKGAFKYDARTILPTVSSPNWSAMIHGAGPEITGITSNDWEPDSTFMKPVIANKSGHFPSIFNLIREQMPSAEQGTIFHWDGFGRLLQKDVVNRYEHVATPTESAQKFAEYIQEKKPTFAFLQLDHVDGAGHNFGHMTEGYLQSIVNADSLVAIIVDAIKQAGIGENTFLMIVSDHGGINKGHGGESMEEITVPVIYCGKKIKKGYRIQQQVYMYDVAANIAFALGLKVPYAWTGRPTKAAFTGFGEPENLNIGIQ
ncbi:phosphodiesterase [Bacteroidia bacterium]|nr:phosphodiesterase [Bacteroidia bacterium]